MQYPIIDLITEAYLNNGWTGLDNINVFSLLNDNYLPSPFQLVITRKNFGYNLHGIPSWSTGVIQFRISFLTNDTADFIRNNNIQLKGFVDQNAYFSLMSTSVSNDNSIVIIGRSTATTNTIDLNIKIMAYVGNEPVTYNGNMSDFQNRLKLPLPHYFPHPVIDALQCAAAGTQTADDTEILRHYLTPLGIGGI